MNNIPLPLHEADPYELVGMILPGEEGQVEAMAQAIVEEYILLGWDAQRLWSLFVNPFFLATHRIYKQKGATYVQTLIEERCAQWRIGA